MDPELVQTINVFNPTTGKIPGVVDDGYGPMDPNLIQTIHEGIQQEHSLPATRHAWENRPLRG